MYVRHLDIHHNVEKYLARLTERDRERLLSAIWGLAEIPPAGDIKRMKGKKGELRLRVRIYRILFHVEDDVVVIDDVDTRGQIYK